MIIEAGIQSDENAIEASQLNQTSIGLAFAFGANLEDGTVLYGRIAAFHIQAHQVVVHLDGVRGKDEFSSITMKHNDKLFFSRYTRESQIVESIDRIEKNTSK